MTPAKGYTEMKDSGIQWIGEVPVHWEITRMKSILENVSIRNHPEAEVLSLYRDLGVLPKNSRDDNHNVTSEDTAQYKYVEVGNLVINKMKAWQGSLAVSNYEGIVSPAYYVCKFRSSKINKRYIHFLVRCSAYAQEFERLSTGMRVGQWDLGISDFMRVPVLLPPFPEQSAIAAYLDTQCAKIDEIIAQAKASIEDYKQWKASIIYEAVTKGLDPNVEMKDSGIEWIGRMPAHWTAPALKHLCTMQAGKNLISEQISTSGQYPVYGGNGQRGYYSDYNANGNFLLVGRQGALCGNVHYVSGKFWATEHAVVTTPSKITNIRYLYYLLIAMDLNQYASNSAAQPGLSVGNILTVKTLLPPIGEQVRISEFLDNGCPKIDEVITEKQSLIDDLESYKKSLIYEVVTGKRSVRQ